MAQSSISTEKPKPAGKANAKPATAKAKPAAAVKAKAEKPAAAPKAPAAKRAVAKKAAPPKVATKTVSQPARLPELTPEQRCCYVEVAAYYIAERRGFHGAGQLDDWVQAEQEIDRLLREGILKP